eukprot:CAMPEP_0118702200 /NCGR_PEP_ID=MMETSP0800-20121206/17737_1 /TAXON_ID=210618 ORGANISM="Striatella unipunctata, Strain CCMP2910" /NCGR_SAMPLE_ID=MMETSP0800 /ASSEMBLY_ACC=CAM_ASM_000638 /LENGTH=400 /DNA_ID=CAMNT_0006603331 /DNA_START=81 /DNA_END=1283 /DNA_ORIENTATION=+
MVRPSFISRYSFKGKNEKFSINDDIDETTPLSLRAPLNSKTGAANRKAGMAVPQSIQEYRALRESVSLPKGVRSLTAEYVEFTDSFSALQLGIFFVVGYFLLGVLAFSYVFENWTILDSLYFTVITFTTVGYGDLTPVTDSERIFVIFFAICGISILGFGLGVLGEKVVEAQEDALKSVQDESKTRILGMFMDDDELDEITDPTTRTTRRSERFTKRISYLGELKNLLIGQGPNLLGLSVIAVCMGYMEDWSILESLYFLVVTATTMGYGDVTPKTPEMRLVALFFTPLAVAVFGVILGNIAQIYMDQKRDESEKKFLTRELTLSDLEAMDENHDQKVTMGEFLSFMLVAMQKVDKESIDELKAVFRKLDADGSGVLQKNDLILVSNRAYSKRLLVADDV